MPVLTEHQKGLFTVFVAATLWSSGGIFIKLSVLSPMQIAMMRSLVAAIAIGLYYRKDAVIFNKDILINALFYAAVMIIFVAATKTTAAANAIFLQYTAPIYLLIFEPLILKTKFQKINLITILISFAGMALFFVGKLEPGHFEGNILAVICGVCLAGLFLGLRRTPGKQKFASVFWGNLLTAVVCAPFLIGMPALEFGDISIMLILGVFQIAVPYIIFSLGIEKVEAVEASLIAMIEPTLNPVWVAIWYGEEPTSFAIAGGIIILITIAVRSVYLDKFIKRKNGLQGAKR